MTIEELRSRFNDASIALRNIECCLLAGGERVQIEKINNQLLDLMIKIDNSSLHSKKLTIVNFKES